MEEAWLLPGEFRPAGRYGRAGAAGDLGIGGDRYRRPHLQPGRRHRQHFRQYGPGPVDGGPADPADEALVLLPPVRRGRAADEERRISAFGSVTSSSPTTSGSGAMSGYPSPTLGAALENLAGLFPYHQENSMLHLSARDDGMMVLDYQILTPDILETAPGCRALARHVPERLSRVPRRGLGRPRKSISSTPNPRTPRPTRPRSARRSIFAADQRPGVPQGRPRPADAAARPQADDHDAGLPRAARLRPERATKP